MWRRTDTLRTRVQPQGHASDTRGVTQTLRDTCAGDMRAVAHGHAKDTCATTQPTPACTCVSPPAHAPQVPPCHRREGMKLPGGLGDVAVSPPSHGLLGPPPRVPPWEGSQCPRGVPTPAEGPSSHCGVPAATGDPTSTGGSQHSLGVPTLIGGPSTLGGVPAPSVPIPCTPPGRAGIWGPVGGFIEG